METRPITESWFRLGVRPVVIATRSAGSAASHRLAPAASRQRTCAPPWSMVVRYRSTPSESTVTAEPSNIPHTGSMYCGSYHGSGRSTSAAATVNESVSAPESARSRCHAMPQ
jgi:hypothetical protein